MCSRITEASFPDFKSIGFPFLHDARSIGDNERRYLPIGLGMLAGIVCGYDYVAMRFKSGK